MVRQKPASGSRNVVVQAEFKVAHPVPSCAGQAPVCVNPVGEQEPLRLVVVGPEVFAHTRFCLVHATEYDASSAGVTVTEPDAAPPVLNPVPVHVVASLEDQVSVTLSPCLRSVLLAVRVAAGAALAWVIARSAMAPATTTEAAIFAKKVVLVFMSRQYEAGLYA